ncbi:MAG: phospholipid-binding protein MlaC [Kiloniellales bacterium]
MATRRFLLISLFVLPFVVAAAGIAPARANTQSPQDAGAFLVALGERAVHELGDQSLDESERERRFRRLFKESIDIETIGRFVLGKHWRRATPEERQDFLQVFEDATVQRFLPLFADYSGETFIISSQRRDANNPNHIFVTSKIALTSGDAYSVEWRVRELESGYRILDIIAEGVSMAITLRQEYSAVVSHSGIRGLVELLRAKVASGAFAPTN